MLARCPRCQQFFHREPDEPWKRLCLDCFVQKKRGEESRVQVVDGLQARAAFLDGECSRLAKENARLTAQLAVRLAFDTALVDELREMLPRLRQLCHPDRHDGSVAATKATQWLNAIRERLH